VDHQPRPGVPAEKGARDRLIRLAERAPDWVLGFQDEVWWSRLARPAMHAWSDGESLRLRELEAGKDDPDPKALACYGLLRGDTGGMLLRFVEGRPVSQVTEDFLAWACQRLAAEGKKALLLIWDNASWHVSRRVRGWIKGHNRRAKAEGGDTDRGLLASDQGSVAQRDRAEVGPRQARDPGARPEADRRGGRAAGL
jgi:hypothetical protein